MVEPVETQRAAQLEIHRPQETAELVETRQAEPVTRRVETLAIPRQMVEPVASVELEDLAEPAETVMRPAERSAIHHPRQIQAAAELLVTHRRLVELEVSAAALVIHRQPEAHQTPAAAELLATQRVEPVLADL